MPKITVKRIGKFFKERDNITDQYIKDMRELVAQEGFDRVRQRLSEVLQHPTGYYESKIVVDRAAREPTVSDSGVIYGGWLEGISSRNKTTRFKGYFTFRKVKQKLDEDTPELVRQLTDQYIDRMNRH